MQLTYETTAADYRHAFHAHRSRSAATRWFWRILYLALVVLLAMGFMRARDGIQHLVAPAALVIATLFLVLYMPHRVASR